jgi:hypothetical protein
MSRVKQIDIGVVPWTMPTAMPVGINTGGDKP